MSTTAERSTPPGPVGLTRLFLRDRGASEEFARALADRALRQLPGAVRGRSVLDLGCGPGVYTAALEREGATTVSSDLQWGELSRAANPPPRPLVADARRLPFGAGTFDAVVCSNVLEHTPEPFAVLSEIERVLSLGGWAYVSWTNWMSPWGGHAVAPLHYVGAERSVRWWRRLFGEPRGKNLPYDGVWPTYIGATLAWLRARPGVEVEAVFPRYWPRLRAVMKVPGLREVTAWNCVLHLRRVPS